jgi:MoaA/NifB/PqqE/SkfB family radical SAM enzyme
LFIDPRNKLFAHMDRLAQLQSTGKTTAPINVEIDLSNRCSLGCEWCHFAFTHTRGPLKDKREGPKVRTRGGDLMDTPLAFDIVRQLAVAEVRSVTWTGGGEPTLHLHFDDIIRNTSRWIPQQGLYTHGGHVDKKRAELLKQHMTWVYVSLDAATPEAYKRDKKADRFQAACDGIRNLAGAKGDAVIGVGFLLTRENWYYWAAMSKLAQELGADYAQFRPAIRYEATEPGQPAEDLEWLRGALPVLKHAAHDPFNIIDVDRFRQYAEWEGHGYATCHWSALQTVITPNGKVWTCVNRREHAPSELGDLTQESFRAIWDRHKAIQVDQHCRVLCRGHLANKAVDSMLADREHAAFV